MNTKHLLSNATSSVLFVLSLIVLGLGLLTPKHASSDPCGMVPPVQVNAGDAIKRVGAQKTYLFYRNGIESFVVRPGFEGKVDNFGMLIPFPSVPSIRKVPNNIFPQITQAIDPPAVNVRIRRFQAFAAGAREDASGTGAENKMKLRRNEVQVKSQEAVGMYQTAVLKAGSAEALKRWMDEHGYSYPNNMDRAANDYVDAGWAFVAVKARVGSKSSVNPKPGMREAEANMPEDATFDGNVQAMGFRFRSDQLVAPMRLSAYNDGKLHNITYVLTDDPKRINQISEEKVRRQISGEKLYRNVTEPLPVRVIGGKWEDLSDNRKKQVQQRRNPDPKNGRAKELFRSDLLAARKDRLVHGYEKDLKALLDIEEALNLRGKEIDKLNREYLSSKNKRMRQHALKDLKDMTLTVVDGEFPRDVLKRENLTFSTYEMPSDRNTSSVYNARQKGPVQGDKNGTLYRGSDPEPVQKQGTSGVLALLIIFVSLLTGGITYFNFRGTSSAGHRTGSVHTDMLTGIAAVLITLFTGLQLSAEIDVKKELQKLTNRKKAPKAMERLVEHRDASLPKLIKTARDGMNIRKRGWSIVALSRIGGNFVDAQLKKIMRDAGEPKLVRTLAAAGRIRILSGVDEMQQQVNWISQFPALARPFRLRFQEISDDSLASDILLLKMVNKNNDLQQKFADQITKMGPARLTNIMLQADQTGVRRTAAGYLGSMAQQDNQKAVASAVKNALSFNPDAKQVPWSGGPLFVPRINWQNWKNSHATPLVRNLISWMVHANERGQNQVIQQIHNNLRSIRLRRAVGYKPTGQTVIDWLKIWKSVKGNSDLKALLAEQNVLDQSPYKSIVD